MACRVPRASRLPLWRMTICSVMRSISSRMWLDMMTVLPCEPSSLITVSYTLLTLPTNREV